MKKLLFWVVFLSFLASCKDDGPKPKEQAPLTVMAYMVADASNIEDDIWGNIAAMYDGLSLMKNEATLLVYWDGSGSYGDWENPVVLRYTTDGYGNVNGQQALPQDATVEEVVALAEVVKEYPSQLSVDKNVMTQVLNDMISYSPTSRFGLIAASHGSAWTNSIFMSRSLTRSFGQDGKGTDNTMLIKDMADAMKATGTKFDFLLFDACFMGTVEVCYDFRDVANYQIISVMEVPAYGFPYEVSLDYLYEGTVDGYKKICQAYIDFYKQRYEKGNQAWGTIALIDSKEMEELAASVKNVFLDENMKKTQIDQHFNGSEIEEYGRDGGREIAYDMKGIMMQMEEPLLWNANKLDAFNTQLEKTVLYKGCLENANPPRYSVKANQFCGLGMYFPQYYKEEWNEFFKTIDWYTAAGWNEMTFSWGF